jgi:hypothetical protein
MAGSMAAKDTTLWDESALLNAFNNAITKYWVDSSTLNSKPYF